VHYLLEEVGFRFILTLTPVALFQIHMIPGSAVLCHVYYCTLYNRFFFLAEWEVDRLC
jgi:hypothetical protein